MRYAYYPGCSLYSTAREYDISTREICKNLGMELIEIPEWICCGASPAHNLTDLLAIVLPVKNLIWAQDAGLEVITCCAECFSRLKVANKVMAEDEVRREKVSQIVGVPYRGEVKVRHLLDVVINDVGLERLSQVATFKLTSLKVASYYGCLLVRPPKVTEFDDPEEPHTLDQIMKALEAEPISWPYKNECCGASLALTRMDIVIKLCHDILQMAKERGAECLAVACPLCHSNLDLWQEEIGEAYETRYDLPIFYFTQLIGLALGIGPDRLGLERHMVNSLELLEAKGFLHLEKRGVLSG